MFRQLDQRHGDGLTVTLEWDDGTGEVWVRCEDRRSFEESFSYLVAPGDARLAFLHPFALRPSSQEPMTSADEATETQRSSPNRWRRWLRQRTEDAAKQPGDYTWIWWPPEPGGPSDQPEWH